MAKLRYVAARRIVDIIRLIFAYTASMISEEVRHRVYLSFQCRYGWHCQFLEQDLKTPLPRKLHFASPDKVVVERVGIGPLRPEAVLTARGISHASPFPDSGSQDPNDLVRFQLIRLAFHPIKDAPDDFRISHSLCHTQSLRRTLS